MPGRRFWIGFACVIVALLLVLEVGLRTAFPFTKPDDFPIQIMDVREPTVGFAMVPGARGSHTTSYFDVEYRVNALGYRDRERSLQKPPGVRHRAVIYGDSTIFGYGCAREDRFTDVLEARLPDLEFLNHAVLGYGIDQQILSYETRDAGLELDEVVFYVSPSGLIRNSVDFIHRLYKPRYSLDGGSLELKPPTAPSALRLQVMHVLGRSAITRFVEGMMWFRIEAKVRPVDLAMLRHARELAAQRGHDVSILALYLMPEDRERIAAFARAEGVRLLELEFPPDSSGLRLAPHDGHFNAAGMAHIADQLEPWFRPRRDNRVGAE